METHAGKKRSRGRKSSLNRTMQYGNPGRGTRISYICGGFKSYYVVWKHTIFPLDFSSSRKFKSYYVVWKLYAHFQFSVFCFRFKSYYVVWKQKIIQASKEKIIPFKSYYVVWKLYWYGKNIHTFFWFKSYYVVWKLVHRVIKKKYNNGLNRTMQYGNWVFLLR